MLVVPGDGKPRLSEDTAIHYNNLFRDIIADHMVNALQGYQIGGPGTTIEIDESMFGKEAPDTLTLYT